MRHPVHMKLQILQELEFGKQFEAREVIKKKRRATMKNLKRDELWKGQKNNSKHAKKYGETEQNTMCFPFSTPPSFLPLSYSSAA